MRSLVNFDKIFLKTNFQIFANPQKIQLLQKQKMLVFLMNSIRNFFMKFCFTKKLQKKCRKIDIFNI